MRSADDQLRMIFTCCHPAIAADARIALTLKTVGGFSVREIARAFLSEQGDGRSTAGASQALHS